MSYEVVGDEGFLGQFASSLGYAELIAVSDAHPALQALFTHGASDDVDAVRVALTALAKTKGMDVTVADTARVLADLAYGQAFIVITNGTS